MIALIAELEPQVCFPSGNVTLCNWRKLRKDDIYAVKSDKGKWLKIPRRFWKKKEEKIKEKTPRLEA